MDDEYRRVDPLRLRAVMEELDFSPTTLAVEARLNRTTVWSLLNGTSGGSEATIDAVAKALDVDLDEFTFVAAN